jgi:uncharacterized membrane protein YkvA (DUF1232 family)
MTDPSENIEPSPPEKTEEHVRHFDDNELKDKLRTLPRSVVGNVVEKALLLRELFFDESTPLWIKGTIAGTILYLVSPLDACADFLPGVGYLDDIALLGLAIANFEGLISDEIRERVRRRMSYEPLPEPSEETD